MCGAAVGQGRGRAKAMVRWSSVHLPLVAGAQIFVAVGKTAGKQEKEEEEDGEQGRGREKVDFQEISL